MLGLSTYAFVWRSHHSLTNPLSIEQMMEATADLGCELFQICDVERLERGEPEDLAHLRSRAFDLGLTLETGTKGVEPDHLRAHLRSAGQLDARFVRSMLSSPRHRPDLAEAISWLTEVMPDFERENVTLGLETYEQYRSADLVGVIEAVGSPNLGICLDPGNSVGALEHPLDVARRCAPYVVNHHVKDFNFSRLEGNIGFLLAGATLGTGLLDHDSVMTILREAGSDRVNRVVEHWLHRHGSIEETAAAEAELVRHAVTYLRERGDDPA